MNAKTFLGMIMVVLLVLAGTGNAQTWTKNATTTIVGNSLIVNFQAKVDSGQTFYSNLFGLNQHNGFSTTYELSYGYKLTNAADTQQVSVTLQGSFDGTNWKNVDTLFADSSETFNYGKTYLFGYHFPYYRLLIAAGTRNKNNTDLKAWVYAYRKD